MNKEELEAEILKELKNLYNQIWVVFDMDWGHTLGCLQDNAQYYIEKNGTFLDPLVDDEENNWGNRPPLLDCYRKITHLSKQLKKIDPNSNLVAENENDRSWGHE